MADPEALLRLLQWRLSLAQGDEEALDPRDIRDWLWLSLQLDGVQLPRTFAPFPPQSAWPEPSDDDATAKELPPPEPLTPDPFLPCPFPVDPARPELEEEPVARLLAETTLPDDADVDDALWTRHGARSLRVNEIGLLPFPLKVLRALGPLLQRRPHPRLRVLDEERSATMSAETRLAWPVFRPRLVTQVRLRVVLDAGVSMAVWEPLAQELQRVLASSQAFRRVVMQRLEPSQLSALEREGGAEEQTTVILLLSDSAGHHWWDGSILPWLQHKARSHPLVLIHTLPQRYWATTALSQAELVTFSNRVPLAPNSRYRTIRRLPNPWDAPKPSGPELEPALCLPVISLDRRELAHWAALAAGEPRARSSGRVFAKVAAPASSPAAGASAADQALTLEEAEHLWEEFESRASPDAQELLLAMAASPVLSLPILRLLQAAEAPRAFSPQPLAEVLVSGLVRRLEGQGKAVPPERLQFELVPAVRRLLEPRLSPERRRQVLASVTDLLERHWNKQGTGPSFKALLLGPKEELETTHPDLIHIANVTAAMLDRLPGRQFRELAAQLRGRESEAWSSGTGTSWSDSNSSSSKAMEGGQGGSGRAIPFSAARFAQEECYRPPRQLLEVLQKIAYEEPLADGDPRYVDSWEARGSEKTFTRLARKFGWDPASEAFFAPYEKHILFFGHIGIGKTTELRRYAGQLNASRRFYVVEVDVLAKLDRNNLQYTEVLMAMAETLLERLHGDGYGLAPDALEPLRRWFGNVVETKAARKELSAELKTVVEGGGGIPGLIKLLATFTGAFKTGSSWKSEWRRGIRNDFTTLAQAFNTLIRRAEDQLAREGRAERVLFLIDGTDKMRGEDTQQFFVQDAEQLLAIETLVIYTAPLHLKYDGRLGGKLDADIVLPMMKLQEWDGTPFEAGWTTMRRLLLLRADRCLFASDGEVDRLVEFSGGHPRELLRLLKLCCEVADDQIDAAVVQTAIEKLAADYRYFLKPTDYALIKAIDINPAYRNNEEQEQDLLHRLAILQYNDGARRSHPVLRTLEGYAMATPSA